MGMLNRNKFIELEEGESGARRRSKQEQVAKLKERPRQNFKISLARKT